MASGIVKSSSRESQEEQSQAPRSGERSKLVERLINGAADLREFITDLLTTQAVTVVGTEAVSFLIDRGEPQLGLFRLITHIRPDESDAATRAAAIAAFQDIIRPCVMQGKDGAIEV